MMALYQGANEFGAPRALSVVCSFILHRKAAKGRCGISATDSLYCSASWQAIWRPLYLFVVPVFVSILISALALVGAYHFYALLPGLWPRVVRLSLALSPAAFSVVKHRSCFPRRESL